MSIDYDGGMVVGAHVELIKVPEEEDSVYDWLVEDHEMDSMWQYYDDEDNVIFGFTIPDIPVSQIDEKWLTNLRDKAAEFEKITGVPAKLIGTQDIC